MVIRELNKKHIYQQNSRQDLHKRFRSEYLGQLRQPIRRTKKQKAFEIGDVAIVSSDERKIIDWPLAKVREIYPPSDGHIHLENLKMKAGEFLLPTRRLLTLEIWQDSVVLRNHFSNNQKDQCSNDCDCDIKSSDFLSGSTMNTKSIFPVRCFRYRRI